MRRITIVGASLAGLRTAEALRGLGYDGRLTLVGAEPYLPYDRPPLSKEILQGTWEPEKLGLRKKPYAELGLELRLGRRAVALDLSAREVLVDDSSREAFDACVIATGASARRLRELPALANVHVLRTLDDSLAIRKAFERGPRVLVVGAGFIGAEVAWSARSRGLAVTVVEPLAVPLARGLGTQMGTVCAELQRERGVDLRLGTSVIGLEGDGRVERALLSDGTKIETDLVVVGVGAVPETGWLVDSGLALDDGVVCDSHCRASAPNVLAAGDVARWSNTLFDERMRVEHWTHAVEQANYVAEQILNGGPSSPEFAPVPFFWSDQFGVKIQFAGRLRADDEVRIVAGSVAERKFTALYGRAGLLTGVLCFSRPRDLARYKQKIAARSSFEAALRGDEGR